MNSYFAKEEDRGILWVHLVQIRTDRLPKRFCIFSSTNNTRKINFSIFTPVMVANLFTFAAACCALFVAKMCFPVMMDLLIYNLCCKSKYLRNILSCRLTHNVAINCKTPVV